MSWKIALFDISSPGGTVLHRWHSRHGWGDVSFENSTWSCRMVDVSGISSGSASDASTCSIRLPRLPTQEAIFRAAHLAGWRGRVRVLQWADDDETGSTIPATARVIGAFRGVISLARLTLTEMEASLDSSLLAGPGGAQFPPRLATTLLIGTPVVLTSGD